MSIATVPNPVERRAYRTLVADVAARAKAKLPEAVNGRIESAVKLVLAHDVMPQSDGSILVGSSSDALKSYLLVGTACECQDFTSGKAPGGWCKHRIAAGIHKRVQEERPQGEEPDADAWLPDADQETGPEAPTQAMPPTAGTSPIPRQFLKRIHGQDYVRYVGLLAMAHAAGLVRLAARFISVTDTLALAEATATFADGRVFTEAADATPANVNENVRAHFARCALTRAKARALRDALNISMCSAEEVE